MKKIDLPFIHLCMYMQNSMPKLCFNRAVACMVDKVCHETMFIRLQLCMVKFKPIQNLNSLLQILTNIHNKRNISIWLFIYISITIKFSHGIAIYVQKRFA